MKRKRNMRIIILAAGYGTRLYPITLSLPKPLICINNKPIINFLLDKTDDLKRYYPVKEIKIVTNNKFYRSLSDWKNKYKPAAEIINDGSNCPEDRLGAVKDIRFAVNGVKDDWLVLGGDNLFEDDLLGFVEFAYKRKTFPCVGLYDLKNKKRASDYGVVKIDSLNRVIKFEEKPKDPESTLAATCVYFFPQDSLKLLDLFISEKKVNDASGEYIKWMGEKTEVYGYVFKRGWFDIGSKDALMEAEREFNTGYKTEYKAGDKNEIERTKKKS